ncbi:MAG: tetratricopeptide repeat protein, partial [Rhodothermales bacterium]|nr:tetratricopeptide repeat protein [Rhodothermales bacterium]
MRCLLTLLAVLFLTPISVFAQSASDLFQQAVVMERTQGDLLGAIALYERVVDASNDRTLTADALVRIGQNYERLGRDGALDAYQRVVSDFGDLAEPVGIARARLAALVTLAAPAPDPPNSIAFKVPGRASPWGHLSADGQRLVTIERSNTMADGGALLIMDLVQNSFTTLVPGRPGGFAQSPRFSPDQNQVAYGWWDGEGRAYIEVLDLPTGSIRTVLDLHSHFSDLPGVDWTEGPFDPYVLDWTEDGSGLLVYNWVDGIGGDWYSNLMMVPVDGSPPRVVARDKA